MLSAPAASSWTLGRVSTVSARRSGTSARAGTAATSASASRLPPPPPPPPPGPALWSAPPRPIAMAPPAASTVIGLGPPVGTGRAYRWERSHGVHQIRRTRGGAPPRAVRPAGARHALLPATAFGYVHVLVAGRSHAIMGLAFFPRGGSSHVARNLACALPHAGWDVTVVSGSITRPGHPGDAAEFYKGLDVRPVDMTAALDAPDPMLADPPLHPSYEERPGAADPVFASLDDRRYEHQVTSWCRVLQSVGAAHADVLHLHHLTPIHEAAARIAPDVPVVGHLHGTELLMLEAIERDPDRWPYGRRWAERLRAWAAGAERTILLTESQAERAERLLGLDPERTVRVPNGFDPDVFVARDVDRRAFWQRYLVDEPRGWAPG